MGNILAFCEFGDGALRSSALANLSFARTAAAAHGGDVIIVLIGICHRIGGRHQITLVVMQNDLPATVLIYGCRYLVVINRQPGHQGDFGQADGYPEIGKQTEPAKVTGRPHTK